MKSHLFPTEPPTRVSIGLLGHRGPMLEGRNYTLQCAVQQAAPAEKLWALFYKDRTQLASKQPRDRRGLKEPQNRAFTLDFTPTREDNGVALWCQGRLELDVAEGRPAVTSANMTARVHCERGARGTCYIFLVTVFFRTHNLPHK